MNLLNVLILIGLIINIFIYLTAKDKFYEHLSLVLHNFVLIILSFVSSFKYQLGSEMNVRSILLAYTFGLCMFADIVGIFGEKFFVIACYLYCYYTAYYYFGIHRYSKDFEVVNISYSNNDFCAIGLSILFFLELLGSFITVFAFVDTSILPGITVCFVYSLAMTHYLSDSYLGLLGYYFHNEKKLDIILCYIGIHIFVMYNHICLFNYFISENHTLKIMGNMYYLLSLTIFDLSSNIK